MALDFDRIEKPVRKLRKLLKKMPAQPSPEQVHDFRTNSRRMEATLQALGLDSSGTGKKVLKPLARLRKGAGKVRDMDVLTGYAASVMQQDGEKECAVQLLEYLGAERRRKAKKLHSISQKNGPRLRTRLKRAQKEFEKLETRPQENSRRAQKANAPVSALEVSYDLANPVRLNHSNLHPFRIKVKDLRNILKLADSPDEALMNALGTTKDAIGEWHDWEELVAIADKVLDHGRQCNLIRALRATTREKYQTALKQADQLRKKYLGLPQGKGRVGAQNPNPSRPVWEAATKLAA